MRINQNGKRRKFKKRTLTITALSMFVILCIIIQLFFTTKWENGNTNANTPSSNGVHTQEGSDFSSTEKARKIRVKH